MVSGYRSLAEQRFPVPAALAREAEPRPEPEPEPTWILIADRDLRTLRNLDRDLHGQSASLQVLTASAPLETLLRIGLYRPQLVLLDVDMPGLDWLDVCRALAETVETRATRVVASAARPTAELEARFRRAGALALLPKPVSAETLLEWLPA